MNGSYGRLVWVIVVCMFALMLAACGSSGDKETNNRTEAGQQNHSHEITDSVETPDANVNEQSEVTNEEEAESSIKTRSYTDASGHIVDIPVHAERIIYTGSNLGDLFALGITPTGAALGIIGEQIAYPELLEGIADIGDLLGEPEKILTLEPDLILLDIGGSYYEDSAYEMLSKIAPTVTYERLDTNTRLRMLGDIVGRKDEAETWISKYETEAAALAEQLNRDSGATATVLLQLGKDLYVMGNKAFASTLYETLGYMPSEMVQQHLIDVEKGFAPISAELLPQFAGDWLFVLTDSDEAARSSEDSITQSAVWESIEAVQKGQVYYLPTMWNFDDPLTKERLLALLPDLMAIP